MSRRNRSPVLMSLLFGLMALPHAVMATETTPTGEVLYQQHCARCHGGQGEGNPQAYPQPLAGDRSVGELTDYIEKSMPEDDPTQCVGPEARRVAEYIHEAFYSPIAQARRRPPRVELARLTVRQHRQALADIVSEQRGMAPATMTRGLKGEYFKTRRMRGEDRVLERVDPQISFDFGESSPDPEKIEPPEFSIRWSGSIFAPDTGDYEFVLLSENGARLWINDQDKPLIDGGVKSGKDEALRETITLIGGRHYPFRLETFKSKEAKEKRASISLKWKPPHHTEALIPARCLCPDSTPEVFVLKTPFPPDDRSEGYERGSAIVKAWDQATTAAALEVAEFLLAHPRIVGGGRRAEDEERRERYLAYCGRMAERAFGRPLTDDERQRLVTKHFEASVPLDLAVKKSTFLILKSPRFLFREYVGAPQDPYTVASRLSFAMWDSVPDETLLKAAANGELQTEEQLRRQAERMLDDPRTRSKLREFLLNWLRVDHLPEISKDPARYPEFTPALVSDLRTSLDLFLDEILSDPQADFRQLLLSNALYLNGPLARFYQFDLPAEADFQRLTPESNGRAGVLTHPFLLSGFAYSASSSPIHRGVFVARSVLGRALRPPPEAVVPLPPELQPDLTTRERVTLQTRTESCQSCHALINPLGFTLENFDAVGRLQTEERGKPIDTTGAYLTRQGELKQFAGIQELAQFLAESEETHTAFMVQLFHHMIKQSIRAYGLQTPDELRQKFTQQGCGIRRAVVDIAVIACQKHPAPPGDSAGSN